MWSLGMIKTFVVFMFLEFSRNRLAALKVRQAMHELCVIFWDFVMNRLAASFSYFSRSKNHWALVLYHQPLSS